MDLSELAKEYVQSVKHMQLATSESGIPWICTVYFVADDSMNLYWTSARSRQHSLEIITNPKAAATIVKDTDMKQALQMTGEAYEVNGDDLERVHRLYTGTFGPKDYDLSEMKKRLPAGRSYWVFKPTTIMFWDEVNFPGSPKQIYL